MSLRAESYFKTMPKKIKECKHLKSFLDSEDVDLKALGWGVSTGEKHISFYIYHRSETFLTLPCV